MLEKKCREEYIRRIHKVQDYIEENYGQALSIEELSNVAGFSKYHFSRIFQGILKESLSHYVNRIRLERSVFLLAHRVDKNITDIAYELGYTDSAVFSRSFKNYYGISPIEYRKEYSKNCKEIYLLSDYNKDVARNECNEDLFPVVGDIVTKNIEDKQVIYVRHIGTYERLMEEYSVLVQRLLSYAYKNNIFIDGDNWVLSMYHDNPEFSEENQFRTSICITIPEDISLPDDEFIGKMKIKGGLYAIGHFEVKQSQYKDAWNYMYHKWITGSGYVPRDYCPFEVYLNDPKENEDNIHKVDIYVPIEPIHF